MKYILSICIFLTCMSQFTFLQAKNSSSFADASYVWIDQTGEGRQVYAYFRNEFELTDVPPAAAIQLYAFSNYSLWVNGQFVNYGPIRSSLQHPYFDSVIIAPYLKKGKNIIAVKVLGYGMETFQLPFGKAGFIAWGNIESGNKAVSLETPGNWICRKAQGYQQSSPRFSFAQGPIEIFDAQLETDDWQSGNIIRKGWKSPVLLKDKHYFGALAARTFPLLTNAEIEPKFIVNRLNVTTKDQIYNWNANTNDLTHSKYGSDLGAINYTYLFSPEDKNVTLGFSWGKFWINGQEIKTVNQPAKPFRSNASVHLKKGWNLLFAREEIIWNNLDGMLAVPLNEGIQLSVNKKLNDSQKIALAGPFTKEELKATGDNNSCPEKPGSLPVKWRYFSGNESYMNPAKELAWLDMEKINVDPFKSTNLVVKANSNQAFIYDFGGMQLGRIFLDVEAPAGTTLDLTWSEDLKDSLVTLYKMMTVNAIARFVTREGKQHFETFRPFGLHYLQVTVRNNTKPVTLNKVGVYRQVYPYQKNGNFTCSDPLMNDIWEMGWRAVQVCSEDSYIDTPFRERGHYAGDFFPEFATTLVTSGDPRLAKQTARLFNDKYEHVYKKAGATAEGDFPLINILVASWYIRQFNDKEFAQEVYPLYAPFFNELHANRGTNGFYHSKNAFIEPVSFDKNSDLTTFQSLVFATYQEMSSIATRLGNKADAYKYGSLATETQQFIQTHCWDSKAGNYIDGIKNGVVLNTRFPISSAFPSLWSISTNEQEKYIQNWLKESLLTDTRKQISSPYGGFYDLASLYQQENAAVAEQFIRDNWGIMVRENNDLTYEYFNPKENNGTISHAWSSAPTYFLSTQVLGVDLGFPGKLSPDTIYIRPQSETLSWAKGTVPHPKGMVTVDWKIQGNQLFFNYSAPEGIPVVIKPRGRLAGYNLFTQKK